MTNQKDNLYKKMAELFNSFNCDAQFNIRQKHISSSKSSGRKGWKYIKFLNEKCANNFKPYLLSDYELEERYRVLKAFLQPGRMFKVFIPSFSLKYFFHEIMVGDYPKSIYKGVSYNPNLVTNGEKLDNLDFFSWIKEVQKALPDFVCIIYDASCYQILNEYKNFNPPKEALQDTSKFANWFYSQIAKETKKNSIINQNSILREKYLKRLMEVSGVKGSVVSALELILNKDQDLLDAFAKACEVCDVQFDSKRSIVVNKFVRYRRYNQEFSKTYTPAVVAEAIYFYRKYNIKYKLGPTSEIAFDRLISNCLAKQNVKYGFIWYNRPFEPFSSTETSIYLNDAAEKVTEKLGKTSGYLEWVIDILSSVLDKTISTRDIVEFVGRTNAY